MRNTAFRGTPPNSERPTDPAASSRRGGANDSSQVLPVNSGDEMVVAAIEAVDPHGRQIVLNFTNELMIPPGEMLLVRMGNGEAQCQVTQSIPGRLAASILGHDYTQTPAAGETVRFGVLAQE